LATQRKSFHAVLERGNQGLGWTIVRVPFDPATTWKKMVRHRVQGEINGFPFRNSLFPFPKDSVPGCRFYLLVNRAMQRGANVALGDPADFHLEPDLAPRPAELPDELAVLLDDEPGLRDWYDSLSESMRREIGKWINGVKSDDARMRRAEQMAERLLGAMEGERELPPAVEAAFRLRPKARAGWARMTQVQRRTELLAVFYYRSVDARERRIEKLCDTAERH
jgi:hypothetical protein